MRTRCKDFLNTETMKPAYSFQYLDGESGWRYVANTNRTAMTWTTQAERDLARACFTTRKTADRAYADLRAGRRIPATT
jgi:hypothetical protein